MNEAQIIEALPYSEPFLFVDGITTIDDSHIEGHYFFKKESTFYKGHFKDFPVTPGVIITECMAQIGLVCLGIYKLNDLDKMGQLQVGLTHNAIDFLKPVMPDTKIIINSDIEYFRFNKLKCKVKASFENGVIAAQGEISGIFKHK